MLLFPSPSIGEAKVSKYQFLIKEASKKVNQLNVSKASLANRINLPLLHKKYPGNPFIKVNPFQDSF
jgi:hypothetical protein